MFALLSTGARAQIVHANDTGGIIPWSCENEAMARRVTAEYCARWQKFPRITGVNRQYGDYISFNCLWAPDVGRLNLPAVAVHSVCAAESPRILTK
jgi:hypothetical protein